MRSFPDRSNINLTRRGFVLSSLAASFALYGSASAMDYPLVRPSEPFRFTEPVPDVIDQVTPRTGIPTGYAFGDSIRKLIAAGVIDPRKFRASDKDLPEWVEHLLRHPSHDPIVFSKQTATYLVDLLWPLGLANRASFNEKSPIGSPRIRGFASTGGWTLGRKKNGYVYFNRVDAVHMTDQQAAAVLKVATTTFRPCCDNSTFFQDCNHGSALLGLLELAASQGASVDELYRTALIANSFWFPDYYAKTALYFSHFHRKSWNEVEPKLVLGPKFSTLSGWDNNVNGRLLQANIRLPGEPKGQKAC